MPGDCENTSACMLCGSSDDLVELINYRIDGERGTVTPHTICRSCLVDGELRQAEETAAFWEAQLVAPGPELHRQQARGHCATVAASLRRKFAALGVSPDARAAAFIARHGGEP